MTDWAGTGSPVTSTTSNTLGNMLLRTAECLKGLRYSISTGDGTSTTLVDTAMDEPDGFFDGGTIFFLSGTLEGLTARVSDWDATTHTFTFTEQASVPGGDCEYAVMNSQYPREGLIAAINGALSELGDYPMIYENAAFITVADQEEYTLPLGVFNIKKVFIATSTTDPYEYQENFGWLENSGTLVFDMDTPGDSGYRIKLYYEAPHNRVTQDSDDIQDTIHPDLLAWTAAYRAALNRAGFAENSEPYTKELLSYAQQKSLQMRKHIIKHWQKSSRPSGW
jgi:hypothetical protein